MRFGVGITTRNRPHVLKTSLDHHLAFPTIDARFVIVDDYSNGDCDNESHVDHFSKNTCNEVIFRKSDRRLGIAKAKNACLSLLADCDHVFLFDDDSWPIADNWAEKWTAVHILNNVGHSMFNVIDPEMLSVNPGFERLIRITHRINSGDNEIVEMTNAFGVVLYYTRECLSAIGGFDPTAPHVYGFEHAQHSLRASKAGFTADKGYLVPAIGDDLLYSVDINYCMLKQRPPIDAEWLPNFTSSVPPEESLNANLNVVLMGNFPVFIPIEDPLA